MFAVLFGGAVYTNVEEDGAGNWIDHDTWEDVTGGVFLGKPIGTREWNGREYRIFVKTGGIFIMPVDEIIGGADVADYRFLCATEVADFFGIDAS